MTKNSFYQNKNILVLGGSFGIGAAMVNELLSQEANLIVAARSVDKIIEILSKFSGNNRAVKFDVTIDDDWKSLISEVEAVFNKIDLVIFSVGTYQPMGLENFDLTSGDINDCSARKESCVAKPSNSFSRKPKSDILISVVFGVQ